MSRRGESAEASLPPAAGPRRRPPSAREQQSRELGQLLADPKVARAVRLLQQVDLVGAPPRAGIGEDRGASAESREGLGGKEGQPRPISIWQPVLAATEPSSEPALDSGPGAELASTPEPAVAAESVRAFRRPAPSPLGDHYAEQREIPARPTEGVPRVVFFGESVAAGYLYAPAYTPAKVLELGLRQHLGGAAEVVDLARTNETCAGLVNKVEASEQLSPDAFVVFTGNNWNLLETPELSAYASTVADRQIFARALRERGWEGPRRLAWRRLESRVRTTLDTVARVAAGRPVVTVIPEVNLAHWSARQPPPWLPGSTNGRWHTAFEAGEEALARGAVEEVGELVTVLEELDGGMAAATHRLAAEAALLKGDHEEALRRCQQEVEAESYVTLCFLGSPRITPRLQDLLRRESERLGFLTVDVPRLLRGIEAVPGRRFFLDYCHLSSEGIQRVMAATAATLAPALAPSQAPTSASASSESDSPQSVGGEPVQLPSLSPEVEARALLGAAVHSAHRLLPLGSSKQAQLSPWLREAVRAHPVALDAMEDLLEARTASSEAVLTLAHERQMAMEHGLTLQHGWAWDHLDADLWLAIYQVLEELRPKRAHELELRLLQRLGVGEKGRELIQRPFLWEPLERFFPEAMAPRKRTSRAPLRCPWPKVSLTLVLCEMSPQQAVGGVELKIVARRPDPAPPALTWSAADGGASRAPVSEGRIFLRRELPAGPEWELGAFPVGCGWRRKVLCFEDPALGPGLYRLTLRWPPWAEDGVKAYRRAVERLEEGTTADLHPVFGELYSVHARQLLAPETGATQ